MTNRHHTTERGRRWRELLWILLPAALLAAVLASSAASPSSVLAPAATLDVHLAGPDERSEPLS